MVYVDWADAYREHARLRARWYARPCVHPSILVFVGDFVSPRGLGFQ